MNYVSWVFQFAFWFGLFTLLIQWLKLQPLRKKRDKLEKEHRQFLREQEEREAWDADWEPQVVDGRFTNLHEMVEGDYETFKTRALKLRTFLLMGRHRINGLELCVTPEKEIEFLMHAPGYSGMLFGFKISPNAREGAFLRWAFTKEPVCLSPSN